MSPRVFIIGGLTVLVVAAVGIMVMTMIFGDFAVAENKDGTNAYVEDKDEKIITTKSGLKYVELVEGKGEAAKVGSTVKVHYTGKLTNGKQFDSSVGREPYPVVIGRSSVIKGWHEGLQGMKVGGKRKLIIPSDLAYGDEGRPPEIPGKATLVFEVEIVEMK